MTSVDVLLFKCSCNGAACLRVYLSLIPNIQDELPAEYIPFVKYSYRCCVLQDVSRVPGVECNRGKSGSPKNVPESLVYSSQVWYFQTCWISDWWYILSACESQTDSGQNEILLLSEHFFASLNVDTNKETKNHAICGSTYYGNRF